MIEDFSGTAEEREEWIQKLRAAVMFWRHVAFLAMGGLTGAMMTGVYKWLIG